MNTCPSVDTPHVKTKKRKRISVLIPVYEGSDLLEPLLERLVNDRYEDKEIFVAVDKPDEEVFKIIGRYGGRVRFLLSPKRKGKVEALNNAVKMSSGEILVFLDADLNVGNCENFLETIAEEMENADILDLKKKILKESFISRLVSYEYVSSNFASYLFTKLVRKCFGVGGAAFAIRRNVFEEVGGFSKVISEDFDLAVKVLLKDKTFKYTGKVEVYTRAPSSWRDWLNQRKRWGIGTGLWIKKYWRKIVGYIAKYPHVALPCAIILFPTVVPFLLSYFCFVFLKEHFQNLAPAVLAAHLSFLLPQMLPTSILSILFTVLANLLLGFLAFSLVFYAVSRRFGFRFNFAEFLIYYFVYQPISALILFIGILRAFISQSYELDWKV